MKTLRDPDQVRRIIDVAIQVACVDTNVAWIDRITRLRAAKCLAGEAGLEVWLEQLDNVIANVEG